MALNDKIRLGLIGAGGMGSGDAGYALSLPNVEMTAVSDIYTGRLEQANHLSAFFCAGGLPICKAGLLLD